VTRPGIEGGPNVTKRRRRTAAPTESPVRARPDATCGCNECNEALAVARDVLAKARRLALVRRERATERRLPARLRGSSGPSVHRICGRGGTGTCARFTFW
jgi:hypothetical protein